MWGGHFRAPFRGCAGERDLQCHEVSHGSYIFSCPPFPIYLFLSIFLFSFSASCFYLPSPPLRSSYTSVLEGVAMAGISNGVHVWQLEPAPTLYSSFPLSSLYNFLSNSLYRLASLLPLSLPLSLPHPSSTLQLTSPHSLHTLLHSHP